MTTFGQPVAYPVLDKFPGRILDADEGVPQFVTLVGSKAGAFDLAWSTYWNPWTRTFHWRCTNRAEILEAETFIDALRGRYQRFWVPTWASDLTLVQDVEIGAEEIIVADEFTTLIRGAIALISVEGMELFYVNTVTDNGNGTTTLTLSDPVVTARPYKRTLVSFLSFVHLVNDLTEYNFVAMDACEIDLEYEELVPSTAPLDVDTIESIWITEGQYITVEVIFSEASGNPETLTVTGPIAGKMFAALFSDLPGMEATFGPAPASGLLQFFAWHQVFASAQHGRVSWTTPGGPYTIGLEDGFGDGDYNDIILTVTVSETPPNPPTVMDPLPGNDLKQWRHLLYDEPVSHSVDNTGFVMEVIQGGEPNAGALMEGSAWYAWDSPTPTQAREVAITISDALGMTARVAVYQVNNTTTWTFASFVLKGTSDTGSLLFTAEPFMTYVFQLGSNTGTPRGPMMIALSSGVTPAPTNDDFADRVIIAGASGNLTASNLNATLEAGEQTPEGQTATIWYEWTAPGNGFITLEVEDPVNGGGYVSIYTGAAVDALTLRGTGFGMITIAVTSGTVYKIQLDGQLPVPDLMLDWDFV